MLGLLWAITTAALSIFKLANLFSGSLADVFADWNIVRSFTLQVRMGQMLALQILLALIIAICGQVIGSRRGFFIVLVIGILSLLPPALTGHSGGRKYHQLAVFSWGIHIVSVTTWIALVCALSFLFLTQDSSRFQKTQLVSRLSLLCFSGTLLSGIVNAATRLNTLSTITESDYGRLLIFKSAIVVSVGIIAALYRTWLFRNLQTREKLFRRLLALEIFLLSLAIMLGVLLSSTQLPIVRIVPQ